MRSNEQMVHHLLKRLNAEGSVGSYDSPREDIRYCFNTGCPILLYHMSYEAVEDVLELLPLTLLTAFEMLVVNCCHNAAA